MVFRKKDNSKEEKFLNEPANTLEHESYEFQYDLSKSYKVAHGLRLVLDRIKREG